MLVLSLCRDVCPELIPDNIGEFLGSGSDGQAFELTDDPEKAIKISALFCYLDEDLKDKFNHIQITLDYLKNNKLDTCAKVYEFHNLGMYSQINWINRWSIGEHQEYILYYYIVEKCFKLSEDEEKVFHTIISHEDLGIEKNYSQAQLNKILAGLSVGLDFDAEKVKLFYNNLKCSPLKHLDLHPRNVMKDKLGYFKLVDFDHSRLEPHYEIFKDRFKPVEEVG